MKEYILVILISGAALLYGDCFCTDRDQASSSNQKYFDKRDEATSSSAGIENSQVNAESQKKQCPRCGGSNTEKMGEYGGEQKYWCKDCEKIFSRSMLLTSNVVRGEKSSKTKSKEFDIEYLIGDELKNSGQNESESNSSNAGIEDSQVNAESQKKQCPRCGSYDVNWYTDAVWCKSCRRRTYISSYGSRKEAKCITVNQHKYLKGIDANIPYHVTEEKIRNILAFYKYRLNEYEKKRKKLRRELEGKKLPKGFRNVIRGNDDREFKMNTASKEVIEYLGIKYRFVGSLLSTIAGREKAPRHNQEIVKKLLTKGGYGEIIAKNIEDDVNGKLLEYNEYQRTNNIHTYDDMKGDSRSAEIVHYLWKAGFSYEKIIELLELREDFETRMKSEIEKCFTGQKKSESNVVRGEKVSKTRSKERDACRYLNSILPTNEVINRRGKYEQGETLSKLKDRKIIAYLKQLGVVSRKGVQGTDEGRYEKVAKYLGYDVKTVQGALNGFTDAEFAGIGPEDLESKANEIIELYEPYREEGRSSTFLIDAIIGLRDLGFTCERIIELLKLERDYEDWKERNLKLLADVVSNQEPMSSLDGNEDNSAIYLGRDRSINDEGVESLHPKKRRKIAESSSVEQGNSESQASLAHEENQVIVISSDDDTDTGPSEKGKRKQADETDNVLEILSDEESEGESLEAKKKRRFQDDRPLYKRKLRRKTIQNGQKRN